MACYCILNVSAIPPAYAIHTRQLGRVFYLRQQKNALMGIELGQNQGLIHFPVAEKIPRLLRLRMMNQLLGAPGFSQAPVV